MVDADEVATTDKPLAPKTRNRLVKDGDAALGRYERTWLRIARLHGRRQNGRNLVVAGRLDDFRSPAGAGV